MQVADVREVVSKGENRVQDDDGMWLPVGCACLWRLRSIL